MISKGKEVKFPGSRVRRLEVVVLVLGVIVFGYIFTMFPKTMAAVEPDVETGITETYTDPADPAEPQGDFSKFRHADNAHSNLPCLLCHRRDDNSAKLVRPGRNEHLPCAGCHAPQFADAASPMCTICHTNAQTGAMKGFPALRSFNVKFNHGKHLNQTNCATCHKPTRRGIAFSVPRGSAAHTSCFQCHTANKPIGSCDTCHSPGRPVRGSEWAKAFQVNFSHQEHIRKGNMNCATCHKVLAGGARGRQVTSPLASMHFARAGVSSCASCHNNKRAFGTNDFSDCKRCHEGRTFKF